jgi:DNA-binding transcriptional LysR family regulator
MDLLALADFNLVAAHGGFGKASRISGRSKATLSRRVAELEKSLGVRLIERGTHTLRLTEEGKALHARTEPLLGEIGEVGESLSEGAGTPRGRLRISAPVVFAHMAMGRLAARFTEKHPEVQLEITAEDRFVEPVEEGYDLVIRVNPSPDDRLVGRCFLYDERLLVAPPTMPRPKARPGRRDELPVRAVMLNTAPPDTRWRLRDEALGYRPEPVLRLASHLMVRDAVLAGAGAALLPGMVAADEVRAGRLACWGVSDSKRTELWALHSSRRLVGARTRAFLRHLDETYPGQLLIPAS